MYSHLLHNDNNHVKIYLYNRNEITIINLKTKLLKLDTESIIYQLILNEFFQYFRNV